MSSCLVVLRCICRPLRVRLNVFHDGLEKLEGISFIVFVFFFLVSLFFYVHPVFFFSLLARVVTAVFQLTLCDAQRTY